MDYNFWKGKKVLVTGHTGFKGSWLSLWLQMLGAEVTGFSMKPPTTPNLFEIADVARDMNSVIDDLRDRAAIQSALQDAKPDIVFHMAAQSLVRYSYAHPVETYTTNLMGLVHLLDGVRQIQATKAVISITSDKCYENDERDIGFKEEDAMGGFDPYSSSKGCQELISSAYRRSFQTPIATARSGNVIGGGDWALDRLVPDILRAIEKGENVIIRNPISTRPWQHVLAPLEGYIHLAQKVYEDGDNYSGAWNFGASDEEAKPVQWIVEHMTRKWGRGAGFVIDTGGANLHESKYLKLDCTKANSELDWASKWPLCTTLDKIIDWHKAYLGKEDMRNFTLQQISQYMDTKA